MIFDTQRTKGQSTPVMSSGNHLTVPVTPPRNDRTDGPSRSPSYSIAGPLHARAPSRLVTPSTPPRQLSSHFQPHTPSTLARAINTTVPTTPPTDFSARYRESVELTPLRQSHLQQSHDSPFHDRHSVVIDEDPFEYHSPPGRLKTMSNYPFTHTRGASDDMEELSFGEELKYGEDLHEVRPISEARRSLYSPQPPIPFSTLQDHPDLLPPSDPPSTQRPRRLPDPIRPTFRGLFALSRKRDIIVDLLPAIGFAVAAALVQPYMSMIIGEAFAVFSAYPADISQATDETDFMLSLGVKQSSIKLTVAGVVAILLNYIKGALWIRHGEGVVSRLRETVFDGVQAKDVEWFDLGMGVNGEEEDEDGKKIESIGAGGLMAKFTK